MEKARSNPADNALIYGKFLYQAGSWDYPCWEVFKIKKPYDHMIHMYTCIATNLDSAPKMLLNFTTGRTKWKFTPKRVKRHRFSTVRICSKLSFAFMIYSFDESVSNQIVKKKESTPTEYFYDKNTP